MENTPHHTLIAKVRKEIIPIAGNLAGHVREFQSAIKRDDQREHPVQLLEDAAKLEEDAVAFQRKIDCWFPARDQLNGSGELEDFVRDSRHDARNQLNHLFGIIQLVQMTPAGTAFSDLIHNIGSHLEKCLAIVSQRSGSLTRTMTPSAESAEDEITSEGGLVLVADDDPENREILTRMLEPMGFELDYAENGKKAIEKIERTSFDAVLLDIQMPVMDGFEVLSTLHDSGHLRSTPVIVVTGLQEEQDAVRCIEMGAEDFLSRPIRPALLMARLNASLEKKRLREQVFEQHFTRELARELVRNPDPMKMQARQAEVTVLFCDIRKFSSISERLGPSQTVDWLSGVMGDFSTSVIDHGGVLVDYTGDELMAMWGAPNEQPNHADLACAAAIEILSKLPDINEKWRSVVGAETDVGIGVNTGEALVGNIGTHKKFKYGPLGTTVNLASRVQGATKYLRTPLLITGYTRDQLSDKRNTRRLCKVHVQNIQQEVELHQLVTANESGIWHTLSDHYEDALNHFEDGDFRRASAILGEVLVETPNDGPSLQLISRVVEAMLNEDQEFSAIWDLPGK